MASKKSRKEPKPYDPADDLPPEYSKMYKAEREKALGGAVFTSEDNETVSKLTYDNMELEYKNKLKKAEEDKKKVQDANRLLREKNDGLNEDLDKSRDEVERLSEELQRIKKESKEKDGKIEDLEQELKERPVETVIEKDDSGMKALQKRLEKTKDALEAEEKRSKGLEQENAGLKEQISRLNERISELESEKREEKDDLDPVGTVRWSSDKGFSSDLFSDGRYSVKLARDGSYITFQQDVEGKARCVDGSISIPDLGRYIDLEDGSFDAYSDGGTIRIILP